MNLRLFAFWATILLDLTAMMLAGAAELTVDAAGASGGFRPLHGVNSGPMHAGDTIDLSARHRELGVPLTRLHDCHWPIADVVDIHTIFPDFSADPSRPESYDFRRTDDYIQSIVNVGSGILYRLGENIEHTKRKYYVHPPKDPDKWAAICVGIVRHYNEGWANGFHHNIRYWEIWNEPENRPVMWTGDDEQYVKLYVATAKAIKQNFPDVYVGGPASGHLGRMVENRLEPSPLLNLLFERCMRENAPLDFFSWHTYTHDPYELVHKSWAVRRYLDEHGFDKTESHLDEWAYLPSGEWCPIPVEDGSIHRKWFQRQGGAEGAAFAVAALLLLQDAPLDASTYYSADIQGFGLFDEHGVPKKSFYGLKAFKMLFDAPMRIAVQGEIPPSLAVGAGIDRKHNKATILVSNFGAANETLRLRIDNLPWREESVCEVLLLDDQHDLSPIKTVHWTESTGLIEHDLAPASVCLVRILAKE